MVKRRERLIALKRWVQRRYQSFSSGRIGNSLSHLASSARNLTLISVLVAGGIPAFAQSASVTPLETAAASIEGVVTVAGQQGQADTVPGVLVKLTRPSAPDPLFTTTDAEGRYQFTKLLPGTYAIEVRLDGFQPLAESVVLTQGDAKTQNISIELNKVTQQIEVREEFQHRVNCLVIDVVN